MKMAKRALAVFLAAILAFGSLGTAAFASDEPGQEAAIVSPEVQPEITAEPVIEATEEPAVEATEEPAPEVTEEPVPEATEEPAPEATEEPAPEATEEPAEEPEAEEPEEDAEPETATAGQTAKYYNPSAGMEMTAYNVTTVKNSTTSWADGWYEVQGSVTMDTVTVSGNVNLILPHATSLRVTKGGIQIRGGGSLTIWGTESDYNSDGTLTATGEELYAGIGLMKWNSDAKVTINGGVVSGTGGYDGGAGIGGAYGASGVTVTINGGAVYGRSGYDGGAGIGAGNYGNGSTVTINGGTVHAESGMASGIGGGRSTSDITVNINGGTVTTSGAASAAASTATASR